MEKSNDPVRKLHPLTSLRFIAAAMILVHHLPGHFGFPKGFGSGFAWGNGVSFFFVLSGFILTYVYSSRPGFDWKIFLGTRLARLWPAHIAAFILLWVLTPKSVTHNFSISKLLAYLSLTHSWIPIREYNFSFVGPSWSISTEAGLYIFFLFLFPNWSRTWAIKFLASAFLTVVVIWAVNVTPPLFHQSKEDSLLSLIYIWPLSRIFEFTLGMTAAHFWLRHQFGNKMSLIAASGLECGLLLLAVWTLQNTAIWTQAVYHWAFVGPAGARWLAQGGFSCLAFAGLIYLMAIGKGVVSKLLSHKLPVLLGEISYSFYLVHQTLIFGWERYARAFSKTSGGLQLTWLLVITLLLAYMIWAGIERPCRKMIGNLLTGKENKPQPGDVGRKFSPPFRGVYGFLNGSLRSILGAAAVLAIVLLPAAYLVEFNSNIQRVGESEATKLLQEIEEGPRDVQFGNKFLLRGAFFKSYPDRQELTLVWKSLDRQKLSYLIPVHVVDQTGKIVAQADYAQDTSETIVQPGDMWCDVVKLPLTKLQGASAVAIGLLGQGAQSQWLLADKGERDLGNSRLLLSLPERAPAAQNQDGAITAKIGSYSGFLDLVNANFMTGWVWDTRNSQERQIVSLYDGDVRIGDASANLFRKDLQEAGIGDGKYCFRFDTPDSLRDGKVHLIHVFVKDTRVELAGSPIRITLPSGK